MKERQHLPSRRSGMRRRIAWLPALAGVVVLLGCSDDGQPSGAEVAPSNRAGSTATQPEAPEVTVKELLIVAEWQLLGRYRSPRLRFREDGSVDGGIFCDDVIFGHYEPTSPTTYEFTPSVRPNPSSDCDNAARLRSVLGVTAQIRLTPRRWLKLTDDGGQLVGELVQPPLDS